MSLKTYHPLVIFLYFVSVLSLTMMTRNPIWVSLCFVAAFFYRVRLDSLVEALKQVAQLLPFALMIMLFNSLFGGLGLTVIKQFDWPGGRLVLTFESLAYGLFSGLSLITIVIWFSCWQTMMTSDQFLNLFSRLAPNSALAASLVLRYIPETVRQGREVSLNQKALLGQPKRSKREQINFAARIATVLMSWSMENGLDTADAMRAKGYPGTKRSNYLRGRLTRCDIGIISVFLGLAFSQMIAWRSGVIRYLYYPFLVWTGAAQNDFTKGIALGGLVLFLGFPLLLDLFEYGRWTISRVREPHKLETDHLQTLIVYESGERDR